MEAQNEVYRYIAWKTPEEMHHSCLQWISNLNFIRDEHRFFEDILKEYTLPVIEAKLLEKVRKLVYDLSVSEKEERELSKKLYSHRNNLKIMIDYKDQLKEEHEYTVEHGNLKVEVTQYSEKFRNLKKEIFEVISFSLKKQKQNWLLR